MSSLPNREKLVGVDDSAPVVPSEFRTAMAKMYDYLEANKLQWGAPDLLSVGSVVSGLVNPSIAMMSPSYLVVGGEDGSDWGIARYSRTVDGWSLIGRTNIPDLLGSVLVQLESNGTEDVVILDAAGRLRLVRRNGGSWDLVGSVSDVIAVFGSDYSIARLSGNQVVVCDGSNMHICKFWLGVWSVVVSLPLVAGASSVAVLDSNLIAVAGTGSITAYMFDGVDAIALGGTRAVAGLANVAMSALNGSDVVMVDRDANTIKIFRYDGEWQENGGDFEIVGLDMGISGSNVAMLGGSDIAVICGAEQKLRTYRLGFGVGKSLWPEHFRV